MPEIATTNAAALAQGERVRPASSAVRAARAFLAERQIFPDRIVTAGTEAAGFPDTCLSVDIAGIGRIESRGKGGGEQGEASAYFELIEHAAALGAIVDHEASFQYISPSDLSQHNDHLLPDAAARLILRSRTPGLTPYFVAKHLADSKQVVHVPAAAYDHAYSTRVSKDSPRLDRLVAPYATNSGYAAGSSRDEAVLHALCEVIERDALCALLASIIGETQSVLRPAPAPYATENLMADLPEFAGCYPSLVELATIGGRVVLAHNDRRDKHSRLIVGLGCSLDADYAAERAVLELRQNLLAEVDAPPDVGDSMDQDLLNRFPNLKRASLIPHDALGPEYDARTNWDASQEPADLPDDPSSRLALLLNQIGSNGFGAYCRPIIEDVPASVHVWQVIVPGAERFHMLRRGLPVEPVGRLRSRDLLSAARRTS